MVIFDIDTIKVLNEAEIDNHRIGLKLTMKDIIPRKEKSLELLDFADIKCNFKLLKKARMIYLANPDTGNVKIIKPRSRMDAVIDTKISTLEEMINDSNDQVANTSLNKKEQN